jgi:Tfp pilus assembly protein PilF
MAGKLAERAEALYQDARSAHRAGKVAQAIALYERALANHPRRGHVQNDFGVAMRATGRPHAAIALYRHALAQDPKAADT